ncbi:divalent-cation tolerance protein CutA [candidate division WOR-3 bacterium]|nr:divalent-cation tolerance protein CutA [candidate division WOR-3 bacterium]
MEPLQVFTTLPDEAGAARLARALVERRLAACAQVVGPVTSTYRWQGAVEQAQEWLCLMKTDRGHWPELEKAITELHPYDTPEIIALPITAASERYRAWLAASVGPAED